MKSPLLIILDRDLKADQPALSKGLRLARTQGRPVQIFVNAYSSAMVRAVGMDSLRQQAARQQLLKAWRQRVAALMGDPLPPLNLVWEKDDLQAILEHVQEHNPALVVVNTSDAGNLRRHLFTPRDWQLIRQAPCPVLCVGQDNWSEQPKILAALDPAGDDPQADTLSEAVLASARRQAQALEGRLSACHVLDALDESLVLVLGEAIPDYTSSMESIRQFHRDSFLKFANDHGLDADQVVTLTGPVASTLGKYCDAQQIDLLVLGTVQRNLPERVLLGSTAEAVITKARTDVLVVKPEQG